MNGAGHADSFDFIMWEFHLRGNGAGEIGNLLLVTSRIRIAIPVFLLFAQHLLFIFHKKASAEG